MKEHKYDNNTKFHANPQDLIGRKVRGFKFENTTLLYYFPKMDTEIGKEGTILKLYDEGYCAVDFEYIVWHYPTSLIHEHLVEEVPSGIIDLSNVEGVEMMVSREMMMNVSKKHWVKAKVVAKIGNVYIDNEGYVWFYAKPIEVKKVTMQEVEELFGCRVEIVKEVSNEQ